MAKSNKWGVAAGVAVAAGGVGLLYWWLNRRAKSQGLPLSLQPSIITMPTSSYLPSGVLQPPCTCGSGMTPIALPNGDCSCSPVDVQVSVIGAKCHTDVGCGPGLICINGECRPESEWTG